MIAHCIFLIPPFIKGAFGLYGYSLISVPNIFKLLNSVVIFQILQIRESPENSYIMNTIQAEQSFNTLAKPAVNATISLFQ